MVVVFYVVYVVVWKGDGYGWVIGEGSFELIVVV